MERYETGSGNVIYRLPISAFPGMEVNVFVVIAGEYQVMIDTGSGYGQANDQILEGLGEVSRDLGRKFDLSSIQQVLITHAHIDHFGGIPFIQKYSDARVGIHTLDRRILANYEESLILATRKLKQYFIRAGVEKNRQEDLLELYQFYKVLFHSVIVDRSFHDGEMRFGPFEMLHVPGHTAGHILIRIDDCVFSGDHILEDISPHQAPEEITLSTGLSHYLNSLDAASEWLESASLVFPGHKTPVMNSSSVIERIKNIHQDRLSKVLELCTKPKTVREIARELFQHVNGYHELLALEEAGAHIEYLHQYGWLTIDNLNDLEACVQAMPVYYRRNSDDDVEDWLSTQFQGRMSRR